MGLAGARLGCRTARPQFDASSPAAYPAAGWAPLRRDRPRAAGRAALGVDLALEAPAPLWATAPGVPRGTAPGFLGSWQPSANEFGLFVRAVAERYSGHYKPPGAGSPPAQGATSGRSGTSRTTASNLAPQAIDHSTVEVSPALYRRLLDAAWSALQATGHAARHGPDRRDRAAGADGRRLARQLLGDGAAAVHPSAVLRRQVAAPAHRRPPRAERSCPSTSAGSAAFPRGASRAVPGRRVRLPPVSAGQFAPNVPTAPDGLGADYADLPQLHTLERDARTARWPRTARAPAFPCTTPNSATRPIRRRRILRAVNPAQAATWANQAEYMSWRDPRVASWDQYLLADPVASYSSFDTGLEFSDGAQKATLRRVSDADVPAGRDGCERAALEVWGCVRPAHYVLRHSPQPQVADIQFQAVDRRPVQDRQARDAHRSYGYFDTPGHLPVERCGPDLVVLSARRLRSTAVPSRSRFARVHRGLGAVWPACWTRRPRAVSVSRPRPGATSPDPVCCLSAMRLIDSSLPGGSPSLSAWRRSGSSAPRPGRTPTRGQIEMFQDDIRLLADPAQTLQQIRDLGGRVVRVSLHWDIVAPSKRPASFNPADPGCLPGLGHLRRDRQGRPAGRHRDRLLARRVPRRFGPPAAASPRPAGRAGGSPRRPTSSSSCRRSAPATAARTTRRSSKSVPGDPNDLPRVSFWEIWNEPNFGGRPGAAGDPRLHRARRRRRMYRSLLDAGWSGLQSTGPRSRHDRDRQPRRARGVGPARHRAPRRASPATSAPPSRCSSSAPCTASTPPTRSCAAARRRRSAARPTAAASRQFRAAHPGAVPGLGVRHPSLPGQPAADRGQLDRSGLHRVQRTCRASPACSTASSGSTARGKRFPIYNNEYGYITNPPNHSLTPLNPNGQFVSPVHRRLLHQLGRVPLLAQPADRLDDAVPAV